MGDATDIAEEYVGYDSFKAARLAHADARKAKALRASLRSSGTLGRRRRPPSPGAQVSQMPQVDRECANSLK